MNEVNNNHRNMEGEKPFDFYKLLNRFLRRKKLFLYIALPIFLGIFLSQRQKPYNPIYCATFDLGISSTTPVEGFFPGTPETHLSQSGVAQRLISNRVISNFLNVDLCEKIVNMLSLCVHIENEDHSIRLETKIKKDFQQPIGPLKLQISGDRILVFNDGDKIQEGRFNEYIDLDFLEFKVIPLNNMAEAETYNITFYPENIVTLALRSSLSISVLEADAIVKETGAHRVSFSGEELPKDLVAGTGSRSYGPNIIGMRVNIYWGNPKDALRIAEALADQIMKEDIKEKSLQYTQSRKFIESQLESYHIKLNRFEEQIRSFKEKNKITDLNASTNTLIVQISNLESEKSQIEIEQKILKDAGGYLSAQKEGIDEIPNFALVTDPVLQNFHYQLIQVEAELKGKLKKYSSRHPAVFEVAANLDGLREQMKEEITKRISACEREIRSFESQIVRLQSKLTDFPYDEVQLVRLERDKKTAEKLYIFFAEKLEQTRVKEAGITSDLKIINPPVVSSRPVNSRGTLRNVVLGLLLSIVVGGFAVFIVEYLDTTAKDPCVIAERIGLPIFASIPIMDGTQAGSKKSRLNRTHKPESFARQGFNLAIKAKDIFTKRKSIKKFRILDSGTLSAEFEAFRKLSINLEFAHPEEEYKVLYVTSSGPGEGKTFVSMNLGLVFAMANKKVIIVDSDFRKKRGSLTDITQLRKKQGLFDILKGEGNIMNVTNTFNAQDKEIGHDVDFIKEESKNIKQEELRVAEEEKKIKLNIEVIEFFYSIGEHDEETLKKLQEKHDKKLTAIKAKWQKLRARKQWLENLVTTKDIEEATSEPTEKASQEIAEQMTKALSHINYQNGRSASVDLIPVGKVPPNPFSFLDSKSMKRFIRDLKESYDHVIIDGTPLLLFADAAYLASLADGVLLTAEYGKTKFQEIEYSRDMLSSSRSNIIGLVMNCVPKTREGYYHYYHHYYQRQYPKYYEETK